MNIYLLILFLFLLFCSLVSLLSPFPLLDLIPPSLPLPSLLCFFHCNSRGDADQLMVCSSLSLRLQMFLSLRFGALLFVMLQVSCCSSGVFAAPVCSGTPGPEGICANVYPTQVMYVVSGVAYCCTSGGDVRATDRNNPSTFSCFSTQDCSKLNVKTKKTTAARHRQQSPVAPGVQ